jgi:hypothetical protein
MTVADYAAGTGAALAVILGALVVGLAGRRFLAPRWTGPTAALVAVIVAYSFLVIEGEILGTFGWFSRGPLVVTSVVVAIVVESASRLRSRRVQAAGTDVVGSETAANDGQDEPEPASFPYQRGFWNRVPSLAASVCGALVLAQALVAVRATARTGNMFIDAIEYHLMWAAHFATSHHTGDIIQIAPNSPASYYPLNSELLHGMGIALFQRDSLSLLLTIADLAAMLLAAYCVGSAFGVGPITLCAVTPLLALLGTYDASAINDWLALWPLVALLAVAVHLRNDGDNATVGLPFVAGLAGGLAMGTKLSLLGPTLALLVGFLVLVGRGRRVTATVLVVAGGALTSIYWYIRNWVDVGSPFPTQHVPGLPRVPIPELDKYGYSVAHYLTNSDVIRHYYRPGLQFFLGRAWIVVILLAVVGVVLAAWRGPGTVRMAAVVAVVATAAYLVTPTGAYGPEGHPYLFGYNVRYALPALALGLLALGASRLAVRWKCWAALVFAAVLIVTLTGPRTWALGHGTTLLMIAVALIGAGLLRVRWVRHHLPVVVALVVVAAIVVGYPANKRYLRDRYHGDATPQAELYRSLQGASGAKIGVVGGAAFYPFLGSRYDNTVTYLGQTVAHHGFADYATCDAWRAAVMRGGFRFIVVETSTANPPPAALAWTSADSSATKAFANSAGTVFAIGHGFGMVACPASP